MHKTPRFLIVIAAAFAFLSLNLIATPLHDAIKNGNLDEVNRLIANDVNAGADVRYETTGYVPGSTPLYLASWLGFDRIAEALLGAGADVNAKFDGNSS